MPVLPEVGSISTVPGPIRPSRSAASIMARPIRSLTEARGLKNSSLPTTSAAPPNSLVSRGSRTSGVAPMVSVMELYILPRNSGADTVMISLHRIVKMAAYGLAMIQARM